MTLKQIKVEIHKENYEEAKIIEYLQTVEEDYTAEEMYNIICNTNGLLKLDDFNSDEDVIEYFRNI